MKKSGRLLAALMMLPGSSAFALGPVDLDVELAGWKSSVSGTTNTNSAPDIDLKNDLGLSDKNVIFARGRLHVTMLGNVYVGYTPIKYDATQTLGKGITYDNKTFAPGTSLQTDVELKTYDLGWTFSPLDVGVVETELGLNLKYVDGSIALKGAGQTASTTFSGPIPMLKAVVRANVPFVKAEVDAMGIVYQGNHVYDVTAQVKFSPVPVFYVAGGYRHIELEVKDGSDKATAKNSGPFLGIGANF